MSNVLLSAAVCAVFWFGDFYIRDNRGFWKKTQSVFCVLLWVDSASMILSPFPKLGVLLGKRMFVCLEMSSTSVEGCSSHSVAAESEQLH